MAALKALRQVEDLVANAKAQTAAAIARHSGAKPTMTEARSLEGMSLPAGSPRDEVAATAPALDEAEQAHLDMMKAIAAAANEAEAQQHG